MLLIELKCGVVWPAPIDVKYAMPLGIERLEWAKNVVSGVYFLCLLLRPKEAKAVTC
mgnify:CR=1|tara:strand:+ start:3698 stop:3868 length:171 start_codon:yes stop_codon:yes gene_type:complete